MIEIEIKIKLQDHQQTIQKLIDLGAQHTLRLLQKDRYYNAPQEMPHFKDTDEALRIRTTEEINPKTNEKLSTRHDITYKGPKLDQTVKSRLEHVCYFEDPEIMEQMLFALHYSKVITILKRRSVYEIVFDGHEIEILIDQIEGIDGWYLEAEIMVEDEHEKDPIKSTLLALIEKLGYSPADSILTSYLELVLNQENK